MSNRDDDDFGGLMAVFGALVGGTPGGRNTFPPADTEDFAQGVRFIPGEVTEARRRGQEVRFVHDCVSKNCWYWQMPDGSRIYYFEQRNYEAIAIANGRWNGEGEFSGDAGPCPYCGNTHLSGGTHK